MLLNLLPGWPLPVVAIVLPFFFAFLLACAKVSARRYQTYVNEGCVFKRIYFKIPFLLFLCLNLGLNYLVWSRVQNAAPTHFILGASGWTETLAEAGGGAWKPFVRFDFLGVLSALLTAFIVFVSGLRSLADKIEPISVSKVFYFLLTLGGVMGVFYAGGTTNLFFFLLVSQVGASGLYRPVRFAGGKWKTVLQGAAWYYLSRFLVLSVFFAGCFLLYSKYKLTEISQLHANLEPDALTLAAYAMLVVPLFFLFIKSASYVTDASKRCYFAIRSYAAFFAMLRVIFLLFGQMRGLERIPWLFIVLGSMALVFALLLSMSDPDPIRFTEAMELFLKGFVTISLGLSLNGLTNTAAAAESGFGALESMLSIWMLFLPLSAALSVIGAVLKQKFEDQELWMVGGLSHRLPFTGFVFLVVICSLAGLPPSPGFLSRQFLYRAANTVNPFLTVFLFAMSLSVLFVGIWYITGILFGRPPKGQESIHGDAQVALPLFLILLFLAYVSIMPVRYYNSAVTKSIGSLISVSHGCGAGDPLNWEPTLSGDADGDVPDVEPIPEGSE